MKSIPRAWLVLPLLLSGCVAAEKVAPGPESVPILWKVESGEPELRQAIVRTGRVYPAVAESGSVRRDGPCWSLRPPVGAVGAGFQAEDWNAHWQTLLAERDLEATALLETVRGAEPFLRGETEGLDAVRTRRGRLEICAAWTDRDLIHRLRHPLLAAGRAPDRAPGRAAGRTKNIAVNLGALRWVDVSGEAAIAALIQGRLDLALLNSRERARLTALDPDTEVMTVPATALDRRYWIVVDREARWVNDPRLPRWISMQLDRESLARIVTGQPQDACADLLCRRNADPTAMESGPRPLAETSRPRLGLLYDATDPDAESISNRLTAELEPLGVELQPRPRADRAEVESAFRDGEAALALVVHDRAVDDALLGMETTLRRLGGSLAPPSAKVRDHRRLGLTADRDRAADTWAAETVEAGRAIPILRVRRWLVYRPAAFDPDGSFAVELFRRIGVEG